MRRMLSTFVAVVVVGAMLPVMAGSVSALTALNPANNRPTANPGNTGGAGNSNSTAGSNANRPTPSTSSLATSATSESSVSVQSVPGSAPAAKPTATKSSGNAATNKPQPTATQGTTGGGSTAGAAGASTRPTPKPTTAASTPTSKPTPKPTAEAATSAPRPTPKPSTAAATPTTRPTTGAASGNSASNAGGSGSSASSSSGSTNGAASATTRPTSGAAAGTNASTNAAAAATAKVERLLEKAGVPDDDDDSGEKNTYIVRFTAGTDARNQASQLRAKKINVKRTFNNVFPGVVAAMNSKQLEALIKAGRVADVQPDGFVSTADTTNLWGLDRVDQPALPLNSSYVPALTNAGAGVSVYVIDTGVRADHVAFSGRVAAGYTAITDGNGTNDCNGHGTHVAGTAAGVTFGLASAATIYPVRVLDCTGSGTWSGVIAGIDWVIAHHADGVPAVANLSLGGGVNSTVDTAVNRLINDGVATVIAAGNSNADACTTSPARVPAAITVAASDITDVRASFSNFGSCVDLFAPGVGITSAVPSSTTATASYSGTSMAAPHVAGAVALALGGGQPAGSVVNAATANVITSAAGSPNLLLFVGATATPTPTPTPSEPTPTPTPTPSEPTPTPSEPPAVAPDAPVSVGATPGVRSFTVSWQAGPSDGGSPITGYLVRVTGAMTKTFAVRPDQTALRVDKLKAGRSYLVAVAAVNAAGQSAWVSAGSVVPLAR